MDYKNGIYFGLDMDEYLAIERLSKSAIKQIRISPADFWRGSWLDPNPPQLTPEQQKYREKAKLLGTAYHCARLEPEAFAERYVREISQADFADADGFLTNGREIEAALADLGQPKKSKDDNGVLDQAKRLKAAGYKHPIWHIEQAAWEGERGDRIALPAQDYDDILVDQARLQAIPKMQAMLSDGYPEVSILYDCPDTGQPMKARLDWLRADGWVEFKSFSNPNGKHLEQCLLDAVKYNRYYIDIACYHEAVEVVRIQGLDFFSNKEKFSAVQMAAQSELVLAIKDAPGPLPHKIIWQQKGGVPNILSRSLRLFDETAESMVAKDEGRHVSTQPTQLMMKARAEIKAAKRDFERYSEIYDRGDPWLPWDPDGEYTDLDFSPYFLESL